MNRRELLRLPLGAAAAGVVEVAVGKEAMASVSKGESVLPSPAFRARLSALDFSKAEGRWYQLVVCPNPSGEVEWRIVQSDDKRTWESKRLLKPMPIAS